MAVVEVTIAAVSVLCAQAGFALALAVGLARAAVRIHVHNASRLVGVRDVRRVPSKRVVVALLGARGRINPSAQVLAVPSGKELGIIVWVKRGGSRAHLRAADEPGLLWHRRCTVIEEVAAVSRGLI